MEEILLDLNELFEIPGFSRYKIDIYSGRLYRKPTENKNGEWLSIVKPNQIGYCYTSLKHDSGERKAMSLHWLVMCAATESTKEFFTSKNLEIDHRDRNKSNNNIHNLRLCNKVTNHKNIKNRKEKVRLSVKDYSFILKEFSTWNGGKIEFYQLMAEEYGCVWQTIQRLCLKKGKQVKHGIAK